MDNSELAILFVTIHDVMAAEQALKQAGLWCDLVPTPRQLSSDCGMAVLTKPDELASVRETLEQGGLEHQGIYQLSQDGYHRIVD